MRAKNMVRVLITEMKNGNATGPLGLVSELGESEEELEISMLMSDSHFQKKVPWFASLKAL